MESGCVFFFKQKTAYEMRISDWSSDVCSSDLNRRPIAGARGPDTSTMLHRVNYRSAAFGSESVAFEEPDQRVRKARSETMGLRVKSEVTIWRAARRVQSVSPPPPLSSVDLIRAYTIGMASGGEEVWQYD